MPEKSTSRTVADPPKRTDRCPPLPLRRNMKVLRAVFVRCVDLGDSPDILDNRPGVTRGGRCSDSVSIVSCTASPVDVVGICRHTMATRR